MALSLLGARLRAGTWRVDHDHENQRMKSPDPLLTDRWADVHRTDRFICARPLSGHRMLQPEDDDHVIYLPPDATDEAMGRALLECLGRSRFVSPFDKSGFFEWRRYVPL